MVYIRPLTNCQEADYWALYDKMNPPSNFIWHGETGLWDSSQMSRAMARQTYYYMGRRIIFQDQRYITIIISKKYTCLRGITKADFEDTSNSNNKEQYEIPDDLAASHMSQIVANYGVIINMLKYLIADSLEIFGQVSYQWYKFLEPIK